jgi:hypothetical protein
VDRDGDVRKVVRSVSGSTCHDGSAYLDSSLALLCGRSYAMTFDNKRLNVVVLMVVTENVDIGRPCDADYCPYSF